VSKYYKDVLAVDNINLEIYDKEFFVILGASGAGKTTTLKMVAGIETISSGNIIIDDQIVNNMPPEARNTSMVFENYALYSHLSVYENIAFSFHAPKKKKSNQEIENSVRQTATLLGIDDLLHRRPSELSGGQRQRVALGRALVRDPAVFLMDEPLSHLDAKIRNQMRTELKNLRESINTTIIYVTHDFNEALALGERIAVLDKGKIQQIDTPHEVFYNPANRLCAESFGDPPINFIDGKFIGENGDLYIQINEFKVPVPDIYKYELIEGKYKEVLIGVRPSNIMVNKSNPKKNLYLPARVYTHEIIGEDGILTTTFGEEWLTVLTKPDISFELEEMVYLSWSPESMYVFSKNTGINLLKK